MRVLVCGGRTYSDRDQLFHQLHMLAERHGELIVIQGGGSGADALARDWAANCYHPLLTFPADWRADGRAAGPIRNQRMIDHGRPDIVLAFPGGRGTADCVSRAKRAGIAVIEVP